MDQKSSSGSVLLISWILLDFQMVLPDWARRYCLLTYNYTPAGLVDTANSARIPSDVKWDFEVLHSTVNLYFIVELSFQLTCKWLKCKWPENAVRNTPFYTFYFIFSFHAGMCKNGRAIRHPSIYSRMVPKWCLRIMCSKSCITFQQMMDSFIANFQQRPQYPKLVMPYYPS